MTMFHIKHPFSDPEYKTPQTRILAELSDPRLGDYLLQDRDGTLLSRGEVRNRDVPVIGRGGQAVVVRGLHYRNRFSRALKVLDLVALRGEYYGDVPRPDTPAELGLHSTNHFKHTLPIVDYGDETDARGERVVFFALPFVPGKDVSTHFDSARAAAEKEDAGRESEWRARLHDDVMIVLRQIAEGLCEYEARGLVHMDVSAPNILVRERSQNGAVESYLLDLGSARSLKDLPDASIPVFVKPWYFPFEEVRKTETGKVDGADIKRLGHRIDLYGFGRLLYALFFDRGRLPNQGGATPDGEEKERFWRSILGPTGAFDFLKELADRLLRLEVDSPARLRDAIYPEGLMQGGPFLWSGAFASHSPGVRIRVRGRVVHVPAPFSGLLDHPAVQRLRRLHQLSLVDQIFPGATHTRFLHAVQVFDLARQYLGALARTPEARLILTRRSTEEILAAALLHDVGQFPFSHAIEDLRKLNGPVTEGADRSRMVLYDQEVALDVLEETFDGRVTLRRLLEGEGLDPSAVSYMLQKGPRDSSQPSVQQLGRDIVAGLIDADRVAYLIQDSDAAGVSFGRHVDLASLLEGLRVCWVNGVPRLGIHEKALSAAEGVLAGVYWMYRNVYWHHMNRGIMAAVKFTFRELLEQGAIGFPEYLAQARMMSDHEAVRFLDGAFRTRFRGDAYSPLSSLAAFGRLGYKRILSLTCAGSDARGGGLWERLVRCYSAPLEKELHAALRRALGRGGSLLPGEVLLDVPLKPRLHFLTPEEARVPEKESATDLGLQQSRAWLVSGPGIAPRDITAASPLVRQLTWMEHVHSRRVRVFLREDHVTRDNRSALHRDAIQALRGVLDDLDASITSTPC